MNKYAFELVQLVKCNYFSHTYLFYRFKFIPSIIMLCHLEMLITRKLPGFRVGFMEGPTTL